MMGFMIYFVINMRFLRFLRFFEKWSELGKIGKNGEKWGKKPEPESPFPYYSCQPIIQLDSLSARHTVRQLVSMSYSQTACRTVREPVSP